MTRGRRRDIKRRTASGETIPTTPLRPGASPPPAKRTRRLNARSPTINDAVLEVGFGIVDHLRRRVDGDNGSKPEGVPIRFGEDETTESR